MERELVNMAAVFSSSHIHYLSVGVLKGALSLISSGLLPLEYKGDGIVTNNNIVIYYS